MNTFIKERTETIALLQKLSKELEAASKGKLSTNDKTLERLLWEIFNKIFTILVSIENGLRTKDSLTIHLVARYSYEMLIVFAYIFSNKLETKERASQFISFNQFENIDQKWTNKTYFEMIKSVPDKTIFEDFHKSHYRNLSNFAHPTMDSFTLNRRGNKSEFLMILSTALLTLRTILEIVKICLEEKLHFNNEQRKLINIVDISDRAKNIMNNLTVK